MQMLEFKLSERAGGGIIGCSSVWNLRFADDTTIFQDNYKWQQYYVSELRCISSWFGLKVIGTKKPTRW